MSFSLRQQNHWPSAPPVTSIYIASRVTRESSKSVSRVAAHQVKEIPAPLENSVRIAENLHAHEVLFESLLYWWDYVTWTLL